MSTFVGFVFVAGMILLVIAMETIDPGQPHDF